MFSPKAIPYIAFALFILSLAAWADAEPPSASATAVVSSSENG